jgi:riboflavin kinase/FMN adenylyltransferase
VKIEHEFGRDTARPLSVAIGFFDGMHRGHIEIARAARRMRKPGWRCGVLSFSNHPASFLRPGSEPAMLTTSEERLDLFARVPFEECLFVRFDAAISTLSPLEFLERLVDGLRVGAVAVGTTFRFGHKRAGDVAMMRDYLSARGVTLTAVDNVRADDGERISSTRIRELIAQGRLDAADDLLGWSYELRGRVEIGAGRGHDLAFPTANIAVPAKLLPKDGVYSGVARYDGRDYPALISIGTNPQFDGRLRTVEVWMRDFHATIYGQELAVRNLRYVREQRQFASVDRLIAQMRTDTAAVAFPSYG